MEQDSFDALANGHGQIDDNSIDFGSHFYRQITAHIADAKCWGCPAYVLDPTLQDGKKLPRWSPTSKLGQFLGHSREHADAVGRIRNLSTGAISSQFHVVLANIPPSPHRRHGLASCLEVKNSISACV